MTEADVRRVAREAVREMLLALGADAYDAESIKDLQADFLYVRKARLGNEEVGKWIRRGIVITGVSGVLWLLWEGLKVGLKVKGGG